MPILPPAWPDRDGRRVFGLAGAGAIALAAFAAVAVQRLAPAQIPDATARQVTVFGVIATPLDTAIDPKLAKVEPQLRKLLPNHGFKLLGVRSKRLTAGQTLTCPLEDGFNAAATLTQPVDENGKVQIRCAVSQNESVQLESVVTTPPNQLFFCEKALPNGTRLLVGIGAR
jgi:hypothetical protein